MKFIRSLILFVVVVLAFSCERKPHKTRWEGIPPGLAINCGGLYNSFEMTCVAGGRTYTCVRENPAGCTVDQTIHCGTYGAPPKQEPQPEPYYDSSPPPPVTTEEETGLTTERRIERLHVMYNIHPECSDHACYERKNDEMPMLRPSGVPGTSSGFGWW